MYQTHETTCYVIALRREARVRLTYLIEPMACGLMRYFLVGLELCDEHN